VEIVENSNPPPLKNTTNGLVGLALMPLIGTEIIVIVKLVWLKLMNHSPPIQKRNLVRVVWIIVLITPNGCPVQNVAYGQRELVLISILVTLVPRWFGCKKTLMR
jgi:hypothetical protein